MAVGGAGGARPRAAARALRRGAAHDVVGRSATTARRPDRITIFRGSLCSLAHDDADLAARVRVTVLHEVGHYFGMTDARLQEMGWA